jgi:hypothetical protein
MTTQTRLTLIAAVLASSLAMGARADGGIQDSTAQHRACANASLLGSFGFYRTGVTGAGPLAAVGILHFDGYSALGSQSISRNGSFQYDLPIVGTYEVAADCTGKFFAADGTEIARVVVVDEGKEFFVLSEAAGNAVYGMGRRIGDD